VFNIPFISPVPPGVSAPLNSLNLTRKVFPQYVFHPFTGPPRFFPPFKLCFEGSYLHCALLCKRMLPFFFGALSASPCPILFFPTCRFGPPAMCRQCFFLASGLFKIPLVLFFVAPKLLYPRGSIASLPPFSYSPGGAFLPKTQAPWCRYLTRVHRDVRWVFFY